MRLSQFPSSLKLTIVTVLVLFQLVFTVGTVQAQSQVCNPCDNISSLTAKDGGPYIGMTGQSISFDASGSWSNDGWMTGYYWDFGDGTGDSGPNPSHTFSVDGVYAVTLWVSDSNDNWASSQTFVTVSSVALPIKIHFDELPNLTVVGDQYLGPAGVRFSSDNFFFPLLRSMTVDSVLLHRYQISLKRGPTTLGR